jgi:aminoglycoside phosphotransferase (APT) family kinase protein
MPQQWCAELEVTPALAAKLIAEQFPWLVPVMCAPLGIGWDNVALLVNDAYVFRFPRRQLGADLNAAEFKLMPAIAPLLPVRVSAATFVGAATAKFKWSFGGYGMIPGHTACRANLTEAQRIDLAKPLARFLRALHDIDINFARANGAGPDPLGRFDFPRRINQAREQLAYVREHQLFDNVDALVAIIDSTPTDFRARADVLVHGDLYARHLIVDDAGKLTGIIDWGDVHLGDPAVDIAIALLVLPPNARVLFQRDYGEIRDLTWRMARFHAIRHTACVVPYAHHINDADLLREGLLALEYLLQ